MPRKKRLNSEGRKKRADNFDYPLAKKTLKKYGWNFTDKTPSQKKKLKNFYKSKAGYIKYVKEDRVVSPIIGFVKRKKKKGKGPIKSAKVSRLEYRFKFQKLSKKKLKIAKDSGVFSSNQFSPLGIFVEHSSKIKKKDFKINFEKTGAVTFTSDCRHDEVIKLDPAQLAIDPERAVETAIANRKCRDSRGKLRKPKSYSLMVNGFRGQKSSSLSLKAFLYYMNKDLIPRWMGENEGEDEEKFADIFHVRLIY